MKHTPVADDPVAHAELEKVHFRLKDANQEINDAKDDQLRRKLIETTWLLQDRLVFAQDVRDLTRPMYGDADCTVATYSSRCIDQTARPCRLVWCFTRNISDERSAHPWQIHDLHAFQVLPHFGANGQGLF